MTTGVDFPSWIKQFPGTAPGATVIFPHAGGAAAAYRGFAKVLSDNGTPAIIVQYPQRADRLTHPAVGTVAEIAEQLFDAGDFSGAAPLTLFGHCMGAVVAFEFARVAERNGLDIQALWVSASEAPSAVAASPALPMGQSEILAEMVDLGGTDPQLLADDDFVELLLTAVRADYEAFNRYSCDTGVTIAADIYALGGEQDHRISEDMLRGWEIHTEGAFTLSLFDGGHFYINDYTEDVAELVNEL